MCVCVCVCVCAWVGAWPRPLLRTPVMFVQIAFFPSTVYVWTMDTCCLQLCLRVAIRDQLMGQAHPVGTSQDFLNMLANSGMSWASLQPYSVRQSRWQPPSTPAGARQRCGLGAAPPRGKVRECWFTHRPGRPRPDDHNRTCTGLSLCSSLTWGCPFLDIWKVRHHFVGCFTQLPQQQITFRHHSGIPKEALTKAIRIIM